MAPDQKMLMAAGAAAVGLGVAAYMTKKQSKNGSTIIGLHAREILDSVNFSARACLISECPWLCFLAPMFVPALAARQPNRRS